MKLKCHNGLEPNWSKTITWSWWSLLDQIVTWHYTSVRPLIETIADLIFTISSLDNSLWHVAYCVWYYFVLNIIHKLYIINLVISYNVHKITQFTELGKIWIMIMKYDGIIVMESFWNWYVYLIIIFYHIWFLRIIIISNIYDLYYVMSKMINSLRFEYNGFNLNTILLWFCW